MEAIFSQNSPQKSYLETSITHKNSQKGPTFRYKFQKGSSIEERAHMG